MFVLILYNVLDNNNMSLLFYFKCDYSSVFLKECAVKVQRCPMTHDICISIIIIIYDVFRGHKVHKQYKHQSTGI